MEYQYKAEFFHDLAGHKEFTRSFLNASPLRVVLGLFVLGIIMILIRMFDYPFAIRYFLIYVAIFLLVRVITNPRKGDIQYKRMLQANNGQPMYQQLFFTETGIHCVSSQNGNQADFAYDLFRYAIESKNLLILVMQHRSCLILSKSSLEGGSIPEFFAFLKAHCPKLKGKKPRKTIGGKIVQILIAVTIIFGTIWALLNLPGFSLMDRIYGRLDNSMSYAQMADALSEVDIHISDHAIQELVEYDNEYLADYGESFYANSLRNQKIEDLLYWEGAGQYDKDTDAWQPSQSGIYWQDMEVWNCESIYTDFLTGVSAMDEALAFTDIQEDMSHVHIENGTGTIYTTFTWNGAEHQLITTYNYDWFDTAAIRTLGKIINQGDQKLYVTYFDDYGALLYYGTGKQVRKLEHLTGLNFKKADIISW